jgi:hypothetical protein
MFMSKSTSVSAQKKKHLTPEGAESKLIGNIVCGSTGCIGGGLTEAKLMASQSLGF